MSRSLSKSIGTELVIQIVNRVVLLIGVPIKSRLLTCKAMATA